MQLVARAVPTACEAAMLTEKRAGRIKIALHLFGNSLKPDLLHGSKFLRNVQFYYGGVAALFNLGARHHWGKPWH